MPYVPMCLRSSNYYVLTCLYALNYYVPKCLRAYVTWVATFLRALIFHAPICSCMPIYIFRGYLPSCLKSFRNYSHSFFTCLRASQNILRLISTPRIVALLWIIWPFIPLKTPKQSLMLLKLHTPYHILWSFGISTGLCTEIIIWGPIKKLSKIMDSF